MCPNPPDGVFPTGHAPPNDVGHFLFKQLEMLETAEKSSQVPIFLHGRSTFQTIRKSSKRFQESSKSCPEKKKTQTLQSRKAKAAKTFHGLECTRCKICKASWIRLVTESVENPIARQHTGPIFWHLRCAYLETCLSGRI